MLCLKGRMVKYTKQFIKYGCGDVLRRKRTVWSKEIAIVKM